MLQLQQMRMLGQYSQLGLNNFNGHFGQSYPNHGQSVQDTHQQGHVNDHDYGENQHNKMVNHIKILNKIIQQFLRQKFNNYLRIFKNDQSRILVRHQKIKKEKEKRLLM